MVKPGIYEHYKGNRYRVIGVGLYESTEQQVVIYEALYDNDKSKLWVRPLADFEAWVDLNGEKVPRFKLVE